MGGCGACSSQKSKRKKKTAASCRCVQTANWVARQGWQLWKKYRYKAFKNRLEMSVSGLLPVSWLIHLWRASSCLFMSSFFFSVFACICTWVNIHTRAYHRSQKSFGTGYTHTNSITLVFLRFHASLHYSIMMQNTFCVHVSQYFLKIVCTVTTSNIHSYAWDSLVHMWCARLPDAKMYASMMHTFTRTCMPAKAM